MLESVVIIHRCVVVPSYFMITEHGEREKPRDEREKNANVVGCGWPFLTVVYFFVGRRISFLMPYSVSLFIICFRCVRWEMLDNSKLEFPTWKLKISFILPWADDRCGNFSPINDDRQFICAFFLVLFLLRSFALHHIQMVMWQQQWWSILVLMP